MNKKFKSKEMIGKTCTFIDYMSDKTTLVILPEKWKAVLSNNLDHNGYDVSLSQQTFDSEADAIKEWGTNSLFVRAVKTTK